MIGSLCASVRCAFSLAVFILRSNCHSIPPNESEWKQSHKYKAELKVRNIFLLCVCRCLQQYFENMFVGNFLTEWIIIRNLRDLRHLLSLEWVWEREHHICRVSVRILCYSIHLWQSFRGQLPWHQPLHMLVSWSCSMMLSSCSTPFSSAQMPVTVYAVIISAHSIPYMHCKEHAVDTKGACRKRARVSDHLAHTHAPTHCMHIAY